MGTFMTDWHQLMRMAAKRAATAASGLAARCRLWADARRRKRDRSDAARHAMAAKSYYRSILRAASMAGSGNSPIFHGLVECKRRTLQIACDLFSFCARHMDGVPNFGVFGARTLYQQTEGRLR